MLQFYLLASVVMLFTCVVIAAVVRRTARDSARGSR